MFSKLTPHSQHGMAGWHNFWNPADMETAKKILFIQMKLNQKILLLLFCPTGRRCSFENGPGVIFAKNSPRHRLASCSNGYFGSYWDKNDSIILSILSSNFVECNDFFSILDGHPAMMVGILPAQKIERDWEIGNCLNVKSKLSQRYVKVLPKLWQSCDTVVLKFCQIRAKVVSKFCQNCDKVVTQLCYGLWHQNLAC